MTLLAPAPDRADSDKRMVPNSLHGVLVVNKPDGWTSHDVVKRVRSILGIQKVGHAGTLDPHATGVLPVLVGKGTKIAQFLVDWDKEYAAVLQLGQKTDTQDAWGAVVEERSWKTVSEEHIRAAFMNFQGTIRQLPPMYSAVKVDGQPLYKKARKGQTVERQAKTVVIHDIEIQSIALPEVNFRVGCSKGTYIRTLCEDIGERLGVGGHLKRLQRTRVGPLTVDQALGMDCLEDRVAVSQLGTAWWSLDQVLDSFPAVEVNMDDAGKVLHGNAIPWTRVEWSRENIATTSGDEGTRVRVKNQQGVLLALGKGPSLLPGQSRPMLVLDTVLV